MLPLKNESAISGMNIEQLREYKIELEQYLSRMKSRGANPYTNRTLTFAAKYTAEEQRDIKKVEVHLSLVNQRIKEIESNEKNRQTNQNQRAKLMEQHYKTQQFFSGDKPITEATTPPVTPTTAPPKSSVPRSVTELANQIIKVAIRLSQISDEDETMHTDRQLGTLLDQLESLSEENQLEVIRLIATDVRVARVLDRISSDFGPRDMDGRQHHHHNGVDLKGSHYAPPKEWRLTRPTYNGGSTYGNVTEFQDSKGNTIMLSHGKYDPETNDWKYDGSGDTTGPHVDIRVRNARGTFIDPKQAGVI